MVLGTIRRGDDERHVGLGCGSRYECVRPELVAEIEFSEWTADDHLRHVRFVAPRDDEEARNVHREARRSWEAPGWITSEGCLVLSRG